MNTKLIIVTDLGLLRAYREVQDPQDYEPRLELVEELSQEAAHEKLSQQVTDQAGRFPRGAGAGNVAGDLSAGERLSLEAEESRRLLKRMAKKINALLSDAAVTSCALAASAPIHKQLLAILDRKARGKISQVVASDLAQIQATELPKHFAKRPA